MIVRKIVVAKEVRKKRVAAYARVSTELEEQQESFDTQCSHYASLIQRNPEWEYVKVYADPGISGTSADKRPGFQEMISDAKAGRMDIILVKSISRFARNVVDAQRYSHLLKQYEVEVRFEREALSSFDTSAEMVFNILAAVAQEESRSISENIKWAYKKNAEKGVRRIGNNRILGYCTDENGNLVPDKNAWIVRQMFDDYADGKSLNEVVQRLNASGAKRMRTGKPFTESIVYQMLQNEVYVGDRLIQKEAPANYLTKRPDKTESYKSYYVANAHEGIVSRDTWVRVKARLDSAKAARNGRVFMRENTHYLYGVVFCGECGAPYKRKTVKGKKVWRCGDRINGGKGSGCKNRSISEEDLLRAISDQLGLVWEGVEQFDIEVFRERVRRVEVKKVGVCFSPTLIL